MRRGQGASLGERAGGPAPPTGRHCWAEPPGHPGPWPGLVVEWRRRGESGWEGRCVSVVDGLADEGARVIERWLAADCLRPVLPSG